MKERTKLRGRVLYLCFRIVWCLQAKRFNPLHYKSIVMKVSIDSKSTYSDLCPVNAIVDYRLPIVLPLDIDTINAGLFVIYEPNKVLISDFNGMCTRSEINWYSRSICLAIKLLFLFKHFQGYQFFLTLFFHAILKET